MRNYRAMTIEQLTKYAASLDTEIAQLITSDDDWSDDGGEDGRAAFIDEREQTRNDVEDELYRRSLLTAYLHNPHKSI